MAKKKKPLAPRCLRMKRGARLSSVRRWLATQKNRTPVQIAKSYRKRFGVDWPCAIHELALEFRSKNCRTFASFANFCLKSVLAPLRDIFFFESMFAKARV